MMPDGRHNDAWRARLAHAKRLLDEGMPQTTAAKTAHIDARTLRRMWPDLKMSAQESGALGGFTKEMNARIGL